MFRLSSCKSHKYRGWKTNRNLKLVNTTQGKKISQDTNTWAYLAWLHMVCTLKHCMYKQKKLVLCLKALFFVKYMFFFYFSPIAKLWPRKKSFLKFSFFEGTPRPKLLFLFGVLPEFQYCTHCITRGTAL